VRIGAWPARSANALPIAIELVSDVSITPEPIELRVEV
jgi:hypothetical protein